MKADKNEENDTDILFVFCGVAVCVWPDYHSPLICRQKRGSLFFTFVPPSPFLYMLYNGNCGIGEESVRQYQHIWDRGDVFYKGCAESVFFNARRLSDHDKKYRDFFMS
jgi:hypothetical protein